MRSYKFRWFLLSLVSTLIFSGCSSTRLVTSWHDEMVPSGTFKKPLVVAIANKQVIRAKLEDEFVRELRANGIDGMQSYKTFPDLKETEHTNIISGLSGLGRDCALVTRLIDIKKETIIVPGQTTVYPVGGYIGPSHYNRFRTYYVESYNIVNSPAYSYESKTYVMEANLYDAHSEKLVWTAYTETESPQSIDSAVKDFVKVVMKDITKTKLFLKPGQGL